MSTQSQTERDEIDETLVITRDVSASAAPKKPPKIKKLAFQLHRYVGLVASVYLLTMSLTGTTLVFHDELANWLCPESPVIQGNGRAAIDLTLKNCRDRFPAFTFANLITDPDNHPTLVFGSTPEGKKITCEVNPFTGDFIKIKAENQILKFISDLHFNLLSGTTGRTANGIGALLLLTLAVTGIITWWRGFSSFNIDLLPSKKLTTAKRRTSVILTRNLHALVGICVAPFLLIWSISGFYFGFPAFTEKAVNLVLPVSAQKKKSAEDALDQTASQAPVLQRKAQLSADFLVKNAQSAAPEFDFFSRISMPDKKKKTVRVWLLKSTASAGQSKEKCQVFLDPVTGSVLAVSKSEATPAGDLLLQTLTKLHFGSIGGIWTKSIWIIAGLTPAALAGTGLLIFIQKRRSKKRLKHDLLRQV